METLAQAFSQVHAVIQQYFDGLHDADIEKLKCIFDSEIVLMSHGVRRNRQQWLALVDERPTPREAGYPYDYQVLSIEISDSQAMVKVSCPLLGKHYLDYLGLLKENDRWIIVNKMYADFPAL